MQQGTGQATRGPEMFSVRCPSIMSYHESRDLRGELQDGLGKSRPGEGRVDATGRSWGYNCCPGVTGRGGTEGSQEGACACGVGPDRGNHCLSKEVLPELGREQ